MKRLLIVILGALVIGYFLLSSDLLLKILFKDKIWKHQVNSVERLSEDLNNYSGIELDLVFLEDPDRFEVYHPPEPSTGLTLQNYLNISSQNTDLKYWFDLKNLNSNNSIEALDKINQLFKKQSLSINNLIIESPDIKVLKTFYDHGFRTSYYLPDDILSEREDITDRIAPYPSMEISTDAKNIKLLRSHFKERQKNLWMLVALEDINGLRDRIYLYSILMDSKVQTLLLK